MARGGYTFDQIKEMSAVEIMYIWHYQNKAEKDRMDELATILGVLWNLNSAYLKDSKEGADSTPSDKFFMPLSVAINPEILEYVKKRAKNGSLNTSTLIGGGEFRLPDNAKLKSVADMTKDDFMSLIGGSLPSSKKSKQGA
jgi:hypothetical protein